MKWQGRQRSSNVEDRRGRGGLGGGFGGGLNPFGRGGGGMQIPTGRTSRGGLGGIGLLIVIGIALFAFGINPLEMLSGGGSSIPGTQTTSSSTQRPLPNAGEDELADFVGVVTKETEDLWTQQFAAANETYTPPTVVLFSDQVESACGAADARSGPFYCPNDQKVYIDLSFYDQLRQQFGAPGDFAQAYVLAHEVGHHVQNITGVLPEFNQRRASMSQEEANAYSVRVELQADCYAGVWANYAKQQALLEAGDAEEAINAANAIGDDTLTGGSVQSRNFTHGTSEQRMRWLRRGMESGDPAVCDTFSGNI